MNRVLWLVTSAISISRRALLCGACVFGLCLQSGASFANPGVIPPERMAGIKLCSAAASGYFGHVLAQETAKFSAPEDFAKLYNHTRCTCTLTCTVYQESPLLRFSFGRPGAQDVARYMLNHNFYLTSEMCWLENVFKDAPRRVTGNVLALLTKARNDGALESCIYSPGINTEWPWSWDGNGKPMTEEEWADAYLNKER